MRRATVAIAFGAWCGEVDTYNDCPFSFVSGRGYSVIDTESKGVDNGVRQGVLIEPFDHEKGVECILRRLKQAVSDV